MRSEVLKDLTLLVDNEDVRDSVKLYLPVIGHIVSAGVGFVAVRNQLSALLDDCKEVAVELQEATKLRFPHQLPA